MCTFSKKHGILKHSSSLFIISASLGYTIPFRWQTDYTDFYSFWFWCGGCCCCCYCVYYMFASCTSVLLLLLLFCFQFIRVVLLFVNVHSQISLSACWFTICPPNRWITISSKANLRVQAMTSNWVRAIASLSFCPSCESKRSRTSKQMSCTGKFCAVGRHERMRGEKWPSMQKICVQNESKCRKK